MLTHKRLLVLSISMLTKSIERNENWVDLINDVIEECWRGHKTPKAKQKESVGERVRKEKAQPIAFNRPHVVRTNCIVWDVDHELTLLANSIRFVSNLTTKFKSMCQCKARIQSNLLAFCCYVFKIPNKCRLLNWFQNAYDIFMKCPLFMFTIQPWNSLFYFCTRHKNSCNARFQSKMKTQMHLIAMNLVGLEFERVDWFNRKWKWQVANRIEPVTLINNLMLRRVRWWELTTITIQKKAQPITTQKKKFKFKGRTTTKKKSTPHAIYILPSNVLISNALCMLTTNVNKPRLIISICSAANAMSLIF